MSKTTVTVEFYHEDPKMVVTPEGNVQPIIIAGVEDLLDKVFNSGLPLGTTNHAFQEYQGYTVDVKINK